MSYCSKYRTHLKFFLWVMPDEPQISFCQDLEGFQCQISVKVNGCPVAQNIICVSNFFWAMPNEPQITFRQALEVFQGQISVKVKGCHVAQNIIPGSIFFWAMPNEP